MITIAVFVVLIAIGCVDMAANWGKAYGNITINGVAVGGMTADEMHEALKEEFGSRVSHAQIRVYANEEARERGDQGINDEELRAIAEQISTEEAIASTSYWNTDALTLKADIPYDKAIEDALSVGRGMNGIFKRMSLVFFTHDVKFDLTFDKEALEALASDIDRTIGDPRVDTTVVIEDGVARAVEGHSGTLVDRNWFASRISHAMLYADDPDSFVAIATNAQSRITLDEAINMASAINRALSAGATFKYEGREWTVEPSLLGDWTTVDILENGDSWKLGVSIDSSLAIPAVVKGAGATITAEDMTITFENSGDDLLVHTDGSGNIPEVAPAITALNKALYGEGGAAWNGDGTTAVVIEIAESDRPETLSFNDAIDMGVITVIGEYTTEFSNLEGTENRNHNIKLAADILSDGIIEADGGTWVFNDRSGDTNEAAGFWSAGSIIDGEYVDSIGGGICQVATTIFNAVYEAGLDVVERHNHTLYIASYPTGRDAAVSYPELDLKWKNNLKSDILLKLSYTDSSITAQLYSVYTGYSVSTETGAWEEGQKYTTRFERDDSIGSGSYYLKTTGEDGSQITVVRTVSDDHGNVVKTDSFTSVYSAKDEVYVVGPDVDTSKLMRDR